MKTTKIKSLKIVQGEPIYHLVIKKNRNFFGNNFLLHNCDYFNNENNDGNIGFCILNTSNEQISIRKGDKIAQGMFQTFLEAETGFEQLNDIRKGGYGSTGK
jgi:dUTP pyrophosphatase